MYFRSTTEQPAEAGRLLAAAWSREDFVVGPGPGDWDVLRAEGLVSPRCPGHSRDMMPTPGWFMRCLRVGVLGMSARLKLL